jgi:hypothetical protein
MYANTKGKITEGTVISQITRVWPEDAQINGAIEYSTETVTDETVVVSIDVDATFVLDWKPVKTGTLSYLSNRAGNAAISDDAAGKVIYTVAGTEIGTIDYTTGVVTILEAYLPDVPQDDIVSYEVDLTTAPLTAPAIKTEVTTITLTARPRKLKSFFSLDAAYDLYTTQNVDLQQLLQETSTNEIRAEIDAEILNDMLNSGTSLTISFNQPTPTGVSKYEHYRAFSQIIVEAANKIYNKTRRVTGNIVIVGLNAANILETHPEFDKAASINEAGKIAS